MTEIPEHLLNRSRERRAAAGLPTEGGAGASEAKSSSPAPVAATPAKAAAPVAKAAAAPRAAAPKPEPAYVVAAKTRRKMPFWAMSALSLLPMWGFLYVRGLTPETKHATGPLAVGATIFSGKCSSCHAADGSGGAGRPLYQGSVLKTFPKIEDQLNFVYTGSQAYQLAGLSIYGNPTREGGAHQPGWGKGAYMPAQGAKAGGELTESQILGVVCEERYNIAGADLAGAYADEYAKWCAPDAPNYADLVSGAKTFDTLTGVGTTPRASAG